MLTPIFALSQTEDTLVLRIRLPYVKVSAAELTAEKNSIYFHLQPYFLHLTLENEVAKDGIRSAVYDHNDSYLTVKIAKKVPGEHFKNLEMITSLLQNSRKKEALPKIPRIEVLASSSEAPPDTPEKELVDQFSGLSLNRFTYGFNMGFSGVFTDLQVLLQGRNL